MQHPMKRQAQIDIQMGKGMSIHAKESILIVLGRQTITLLLITTSSNNNTSHPTTTTHTIPNKFMPC